VSDVPDQAIRWGVEYVMQGDRQLDNAEPGAQMTSRDRHRVDCFGAQFVGNLPELALFELPQVRRSVNPVE